MQMPLYWVYDDATVNDCLYRMMEHLPPFLPGVGAPGFPCRVVFFLLHSQGYQGPFTVFQSDTTAGTTTTIAASRPCPTAGHTGLLSVFIWNTDAVCSL